MNSGRVSRLPPMATLPNVISGAALGSPAIYTVEEFQMVVQALWAAVGSHSVQLAGRNAPSGVAPASDLCLPSN